MPLEIFELTAKGEQVSRLPQPTFDPRLLAILRQVDGKRTLEQLSAYAKNLGLTADDIWQLAQQGLIAEKKLIPEQASWGDTADSISYDKTVEKTASGDFYSTVIDPSKVYHSDDQGSYATVHPALKPKNFEGGMSEKLTDLAEVFFNKLPDTIQPQHTIKLHPHILNRIEIMQNHPKDVIAYLDKLLLLTEDTNRQGFSINVVIELTNLKEYLEKNGKFF